MTIPHKARTPNVQGLRLEIVRATREVLTAGVEHIRVEGVEVPIYGVARRRSPIASSFAAMSARTSPSKRSATPYGNGRLRRANS